MVPLSQDGELHAPVPGAVRLADVFAYRADVRARLNRFITESSAPFADADPESLAEAKGKR